MDKQTHSEFYYGLANEGLWPLCHIAFTRPVFRPRDWKSYQKANHIFADAVLEEAGDGPAFVFIQDYRFALLPRMLKERNSARVLVRATSETGLSQSAAQNRLTKYGYNELTEKKSGTVLKFFS
jgi:magnesium-transporting ATPase (P-type)